MHRPSLLYITLGIGAFTPVAGKQLYGLGDAKILGNIHLEITLDPKIKCKQEFSVVDNIGGIILLGRKFLTKFNSLEVNWKEMILKIEGVQVKGEQVIQGGKLDSRFQAAHEQVLTDRIEDQLKAHVSKNTFLNTSQKQKLTELLLQYSDIFYPRPQKSS